MKIQYFKICGTQVKQCWEGNLKHIRKEEKPQISNLSFCLKKKAPQNKSNLKTKQEE